MPYVTLCICNDEDFEASGIHAFDGHVKEELNRLIDIERECSGKIGKIKVSNCKAVVSAKFCSMYTVEDGD